MTQSAKVPFVDLVSLHKQLGPELLEVCRRVLETAGFVGGPEVDGFEQEFAEYCGTKHCVGVNSGTDALRFALIAAGVRPGDIVITVPNTFIATTEAISQAGAQPDFVDVDDRTLTMDPEKLREYLENCTLDVNTGRYIHKKLAKPVAAVVPVHLYGQIADMDPILEIAARYNLVVVEDACQAHGAEYLSAKQGKWLKAGSIGHAAAFSFYPGKNLGACGEGGAVTTSNAELARVCVMLRDHGSAKKYYHDLEGYNGRLDSIQAGILRIKLKHLTQWNEQRRECARIYQEFLATMSESITLPVEASFSKSVYHLYVVRTPYRSELQNHLTQAGIGTGIHYPIPLHLQRAYEGMGWRKGAFPIAEEAAEQIVSLPMFAGLSRDQQEQIRDAVANFAGAGAIAVK